MYAVELSGIEKKYKDFALENISFKLPSGCILGIIGENGAGKSTLIKLITGRVSKTSGDLAVLGESNFERFFTLRDEIGIVPDEVAFPDNFKIKDVNTFLKLAFKRWDEKKFFEYVERFKIPPKTKFKKLSFGMKKRLGIAAALSHNARLLILDEATSGLDPVARDDLVDILNEFTRDDGHSIIFSSHIVSDLEKLCDYIALIHRGRLLCFEEKDVLLDSYRRIICSKEDIPSLNSEGILSIKQSQYGAEVIIKSEYVPKGFDSTVLLLEELFVGMVKEGK